MEYYRQNMVNAMAGWLGAVQGDAKHKDIVDTYNSHKPLARGYTLKYSDDWCVATVSAAAIKCGYTDIIPTEVSTRVIDDFKKLGCWVEDDAYTPNAGDLIFFYWGDDGKGDYTGPHASHVGLVEKCVDGVITTIEGNYDRKCQKRVIKVNSRYIRGFATPKYTADAPKQSKPTPEPIMEVKYTVKKGDNLAKIAERFGTDVATITINNPIIKNPNLIQPGWELVIKGGKERTITYVVVKGDSLVKIANKFKKNGIAVSWTQIAKLNGIKFPYIIHAGDVLVIEKF